MLAFALLCVIGVVGAQHIPGALVPLVAAQLAQTETPLETSYFLEGLEGLRLRQCSTCGEGQDVISKCTINADTVCGQANPAVCENSAKDISCPAGKVITINSAFYGRFDGNTCGTNANTACSSRTFVEKVRKECEARNSCSAQATNGFAGGDPCGGVVKYAKIEHTCQDMVQNQNYACEGQNVALSCPSDKPVILVDSAFYGRRDSSLCPGANVQRTDCSADEATLRAAQQCSFRRGSCNLASSNSIYGDPCGGVTKYMKVQYSCAAAEPVMKCEGQSATISCTDNKKIHIIDAFYGRVASQICPGANSGNTNCPGDINFRRRWWEDVHNACEGKATCTVTSSNRLGDPCGGTYKYMSIRHECV